MKVGYVSPRNAIQQENSSLLKLQQVGCEALVTEDNYNEMLVDCPALLTCLFRLKPGDELLVTDFDGLDSALFIGHFNALRLRDVRFSTFNESGNVESVDEWIEALAECHAYSLIRRIRSLRKMGYACCTPDGSPEFDIFRLREIGCEPVIQERHGTTVPAALLHAVERLRLSEALVFARLADLPSPEFYRPLADAIERGVEFYVLQEGDTVELRDEFRSV